MKKCMLFVALGLLGAAALAEEAGRVISTVPAIQQVAVPRQVCNQQQVITQQQQSSGGGGIVGAVVGGLLGNTIGHGGGRAAATGLGVVMGAAVGDSVERRGNGPAYATQQACSTQTFYENRTVGYNVTYEYAGKQYTVQMPYDPGPTVRLQVTPVGSNDALPAQGYGGMRPAPQQMTGPITYVPPVIDQSVTVLPAAVVPIGYYPAYYRPYPYYPVGVSLSFGYRSGWYGHHHHRYWR